MSPLRFRAWHPIDMEMCPVTGLHFFEGHELIELSVDTPRGEEQNVGALGYIVMQSTSLHDKNGVEIFEGDISEIALSEIPKRFSVVYDIESASFRWYRNKDGDHFLSLDPEAWKPAIIGNIYENPDLLK